MAHDVHHRDIDAACSHARRSLKPQQAATDNDAFVLRPKVHHPLRVFQIAVGNDAFQIVTRQGDHKGGRSRAKHQLVVAQHITILGGDRFRSPVDCGHFFAKATGHTILRVPFG